ncbi:MULTISPECIES: DUF1049 domain-containing protein [Brevibacillus]|uniref:Uncharacterized protein n=1 Tax=Brevibacillus parabrevis TaxID=54914 RepID=A0A4Y3PLH2_BREPA|nr:MULTISPECIES: DUF1049 domain-containing protein [Brevibacillus]MBU8713395.1 DUF1049 domain-containing protein [Brevibacillus parabrevis]MDH6351722.1 putative PurR-regulated permease PerM [Brevibacillus sp. 1238]RNB97082.1 DUF1049 domain-containing protein [Brevibacillus parabrevis]UED68942.1 DUF1049 domain-containing protein [Brevibacillus sp. HD3.3A]WDV95231.1 DUF1049 domain-containing protein [Brevibacillus parabrevis]
MEVLLLTGIMIIGLVLVFASFFTKVFNKNNNSSNDLQSQINQLKKEIAYLKKEEK